METTALSTTQEALLQAKDIIAQNIASNEKAKEVMKDLVDQMMANIGGGEEGSAASEAISQEMMIKMMENSPLRALRSFAGISTEEVQELIKKLKEAVK